MKYHFTTVVRMMTTEQLAEELHKFYRAAFKKLHISATSFGNCEGRHDHGWKGCHAKAYFIKRAQRIEDSLFLEYDDA